MTIARENITLPTPSRESSQDAAIHLRGVRKTYVSRTGEQYLAVDGVDLEVPRAGFVTVVGPSGCGKSTLLGMIAGLDPASSGEVLVGGLPVGDVLPDVGLMFQKDALLPWRTVLDNVALPLRYRGVSRRHARAAATEWIHRVGLGGALDRYPHQLSGGMRKRVSLAQTMVYEPAIVLMDEPFSALDAQTRALMENDLLDIWAAGGRTVLFITHDLDEAIALSDEVAVMTAGPGRIKAIEPIDLPRPRDLLEIRSHDHFSALHARLWSHLRDEVVGAGT